MQTRPDIIEPKVNSGAYKVAEKMIKNGCSILRIPPSEVVRVLPYSILSDILDTVLMDIVKVCPEILDTNAQVSFAPSVLKAYLYILALHHFERSGVLVKTGGQSYPDATGYEAPVPLLAALQGIGPYAEGDCAGIAQYVAPSAVPVLGNDCIATGTPVESSLYLSGVLACNKFVPSNNEYASAGAAANVTTVIASWASFATQISSALRTYDYPTRPMWGQPPAVPDGSFWGQWASIFATYNSGTGITNPMFSCPFIKWDEEMSYLYTNAFDIANNGPGYPGALRAGLMQNEFPLNGTSTAIIEPYAAHKLAFCLVLRNTNYYPGIKPSAMRSWHGDKLTRFMPIAVPVSFAGFNEVVARCIVQQVANGAGVDATLVYATCMLHVMLALRRIQKFYLTMGLLGSGTSAEWQRNLLPSTADSLTGFAGCVQLINDLGPVVLEGRLHVPIVGAPDGGLWAANWQTWSVAAGSPFALGFTKTAGVGDPTFSWRDVNDVTQTVSGGWVTAMVAVTGFMFVPWQSLGAMHTYFLKFASLGVQKYGSGDIDYPVSRGPRGSVGLLCRSTILTSGTARHDVDPITQLSLNYQPLATLISDVAIGGAELVMAAIARWSYCDNRYGAIAKYGRAFVIRNGDAFIERYCANVMGPGGTFLDHLSESMHARHGDTDLDMGLTTPGDNADACLWDAVKKVVGTVAQTLQPAASEAAKIGCGAVPGVGQFLRPMCGEVAKSLTTYVADISRVSSNRQEKEPLSRGLQSLDKLIKEAPKYSVGVVAQERRVVSPVKPAPKKLAPKAKGLKPQGGIKKKKAKPKKKKKAGKM